MQSSGEDFAGTLHEGNKCILHYRAKCAMCVFVSKGNDARRWREKMHHQEQIGDYVIELETPRSFWGVRMADAEEYLSQHNSKSEAKAAVKRYQQGDKRRQRSA